MAKGTGEGNAVVKVEVAKAGLPGPEFQVYRTLMVHHSMETEEQVTPVILSS